MNGEIRMSSNTKINVIAYGSLIFAVLLFLGTGIFFSIRKCQEKVRSNEKDQEKIEKPCIDIREPETEKFARIQYFYRFDDGRVQEIYGPTSIGYCYPGTPTESGSYNVLIGRETGSFLERKSGFHKISIPELDPYFNLYFPILKPKKEKGINHDPNDNNFQSDG